MSMPGLLLSPLYFRLSTEGVDTIGWHRYCDMLCKLPW